MAELSKNTVKKLPRDRKASFTSIEANLISSQVTNELELLKGGFNKEVKNQKKNKVWKPTTGGECSRCQLHNCNRNQKQI